MKQTDVWIHVGILVVGLGLGGCAEFDRWDNLHGQGLEAEGLEYEAPLVVTAPQNASANDMRVAVEELQAYLKEQETRIEGLLHMRADLDDQIQEMRESMFVPMRDRVETFEHRLATQESQATNLSTKLEREVAPLSAVVQAQGERLDHHDQEIVLLIDSANQDKKAMRTNLGNFRETLLGFHSIMSKLETLVYDEEFRATNAEVGLKALVTDEANNRKQLWEASHQQSKVVAGLQEKIKRLGTLNQRVVALHSYINQVQQGIFGKLETLESQPVTHEKEPMAIEAQTRSRSALVPVVVPDAQTLIKPFAETGSGVSDEASRAEPTILFDEGSMPEPPLMELIDR